MDYQITCVCGHSFLVSGKQIAAGPVTCPACRQRLSPVIESPPGSASTSPAALPAASASATDIDATIVSEGPSPAEGTAEGPSQSPPPAADAPAGVLPRATDATKRCPFCGEIILAIARKCKHCGEFLDREVPTAPAAAKASAPLPHAPGVDVPPVFALSVSQWDNFWKFLILATLVAIVAAALVFIPPLKDYAVVGTMGAMVIAAFFGWFFYLSARNTRCLIRPTRIDTEEGILSKDINSLELFRISDMELKQGVFERILGIGTIKLITADEANPDLVLYQIPRVREVYRYIQNQIPIAAKQRGAVFMET